MSNQIARTTAAKAIASAPSTSGATKAEYKKALSPLFEAALAANGIRNSKKPNDIELRGAVTIDMTPKHADGVQELKLTKGGDVYVTRRFPERPEQWQQVKPSFVRQFFKAELAKEQTSVKRPVSNPGKYPSFDVTPPNADGVARLYSIGGKSYVTYRGPTMPERWYRLDAQPAAGTWKP